MKGTPSLLHDHAITRVLLETVNSCRREWLCTISSWDEVGKSVLYYFTLLGQAARRFFYVTVKNAMLYDKLRERAR